MTISSRIATAAAALGVASSVSLAAGEIHPAAQVATYAPMQAFSHVVEAKRVIGYFVRTGDACRVSFYVAEADEEALSIKPIHFVSSVPVPGRSGTKRATFGWA
jgi:hypothetical protein